MLLLPLLEAQPACGQLVDRAGDKPGGQLGTASGLLCQGNAPHRSTVGTSFVLRFGRGGPGLANPGPQRLGTFDANAR